MVKKSEKKREIKHKKRGALRAVGQLASFHKAGKAVISTLELDKVLRLITLEAASIMRVNVCSLRLLGEQKENLLLRATCGHSEEYIRKKAIVKVDKSVTGKAVRDKKPVFIKDVRKHPDYQYRSLAREEGLVSLLAVPLIRHGDVIGVINVYTSESHVFDTNEIKVLSMFAEHAAIAIENAKLFGHIQENYLNTIKTLGAIIDAKDAYTRGHSESVMGFATAIAEKMDLPMRRREMIRYASFLHDIGKIGIDINILTKSGPLTQGEWETIVTHPRVGSDIVRQLGFLDEVVPIILHHHERYDGEGYPEGLKKAKIPIEARILGIADAFDAMISERPYRHSPFTPKKAMAEIKKGAGIQFDPKVAKVFLGLLKKRKGKIG